jgi:hypothetical protein
VDDQGRRHYSDRPVEGATQIELAGPQTFSGGAASTRSAPQTEAEQQLPAANYSVLDVISPEDQQTLSNIGGSLTMEVAVYPRLQAAHRIDAIFDGQHLPIGSRDLSITIPNVVRGEHTIQAVIMGADGEELLRSATVTVFVRQTSILTPPPQRVVPTPPPPPRPPANN